MVSSWGVPPPGAGSRAAAGPGQQGGREQRQQRQLVTGVLCSRPIPPPGDVQVGSPAFSRAADAAGVVRPRVTVAGHPGVRLPVVKPRL